jgi:hypothetical protein
MEVLKKLGSRKLACAIAGMLSIVGVVIGSAVVGDVDKDVLLSAILLIAGLGGYLVYRQADIDSVA